MPGLTQMPAKGSAWGREAEFGGRGGPGAYTLDGGTYEPAAESWVRVATLEPPLLARARQDEGAAGSIPSFCPAMLQNPGASQQKGNSSVLGQEELSSGSTVQRQLAATRVSALAANSSIIWSTQMHIQHICMESGTHAINTPRAPGGATPQALQRQVQGSRIKVGVGFELQADSL